MTENISTRKKDQPKILMLCKRHYTNRDLIANRFGRLFHLPVQLAQKGIDFSVVTADYKNKKAKKKYINGVSFYSFPFRTLSLIPFFYRFARVIKTFQPDLIIASSDSHFGIMGLITAKICKIPFVFDIYDDYRVFGTNKLPLMKTFFMLAVKKADLVVYSSKPLHKQLHEKNGSSVVIENGVDTDLFCPSCSKGAREKLNICTERIVVGYFGAISKNRGVETLIQAVSILKQELPQISLLLAGKNDLGISFDKSYVDYRGEVDQKDVPVLINSSDIVVIPYLPDPQVNMSNPCKLAEYLACRIPIVATKVTDLAVSLEKTPEALCVPDDAEDMARAIKWQIENKKTLSLPDSLNWEALGARLKNELVKLL